LDTVRGIQGFLPVTTAGRPAEFQNGGEVTSTDWAMPCISVVVPVLNAMKYLRQSLPAVIGAIERYGTAELILVDNGSTDGSYEYMQAEYGGRAKILRLPGVTISTLRNEGARIATGEFLSFVDSDCVVPPTYLINAMDVFRSVSADAAGCEYELPRQAKWLEATWHYLHWRTRDEYVPYLYSGNFMIRRSVFEKAGGFDESLVTGEDAEFGLRLTSMGFKIYRTEQIPAIHLGNPKTVSGFFRKQVWHSLGMFGSVNISWLDKTLLMTLADLCLIIIGVGLLFWRDLSWGWRVAGLVATIGLAPAVTVGYRYLKKGSIYRPLRSLILYRLYFAARIYALFKLGLQRILSPRR
jgi:glycosyltransferase involved in cell wall biosynthesis